MEENGLNSGMFFPKKGGLNMPVKVFLSPNGKQWYVRMNWQGESRICTEYNNQRFPADKQEWAEFVAKMALDQMTLNTFAWDYWFPKLRRQYLFKEAYWKWMEYKPLAPSTYKNRVFAYQHFRHMEDRDARELRSTDFALSLIHI